MNIRLLYTKIGHHSAHSGYDRLIEYVPGATRIGPLRAGPLNRIAFRACRRWRTPRCDVSWYSKEAFMTEVAVALDSIRRGGGIYHYIYGENQFWLLGGRRGRKRKLVATFHQPEAQLRAALGDTGKLRALQRVVVVGRNQAAFFEDIVGRERVHFIPHGVDGAFFRPPDDPPAQARPMCLFVGSWLRDFTTLRRVIDQTGRLRGNAIEFVVVTRAANFIHLTGLANVRLRTNVAEAELLRLYQTADVTVLPLLDSTANNVLLESLACGTPVVLSDVGGVRDYADASCAVFSPRADAESMAAAIDALLQDPVRLAGMRTAARTRALEFAWPKVGQAMLELYKNVAQNP